MDTIIRNARLVNEGEVVETDLWIRGGIIHKIGNFSRQNAHNSVDAQGLYLLPGAIDDQVHFREPGLTHKGNILTESRAAVAGGITSYMEMPNTVPQALTQELLEDKYQTAARDSYANFSFFMGASNHNIEEVLKTNSRNVCGVKVFMGSSTGDMLVDDVEVLENIFSKVPMLIATHCEKEEVVRANLENYKKQYGSDIPVRFHPVIRSAEACYLSSSQAVDLARKYNSRLHILHISTEKELELFSNKILRKNKRITSEACIHHLWFTEEDYLEKGMFIKWNPAVKKYSDREAIRKAVIDGRIDVIATDHAPHTFEEKSNPYVQAPSGGPMVQHALPAMLELCREGVFDIEMVVDKMCHAPADILGVENRGYLREGYQADLVLVDLDSPWKVETNNIAYKCKWSPLEGVTLSAQVVTTWVNGQQVYHKGEWDETVRGERLLFN